MFLVYLRKAEGRNRAWKSNETQLFFPSFSPLSKAGSEMCLFVKLVTPLLLSILSLTPRAAQASECARAEMPVFLTGTASVRSCPPPPQSPKTIPVPSHNVMAVSWRGQEREMAVPPKCRLSTSIRRRVSVRFRSTASAKTKTKTTTEPRHGIHLSHAVFVQTSEELTHYACRCTKA